MTGWQQFSVWMFGLFCLTLAVFRALAIVEKRDALLAQEDRPRGR